MAVGCCSLMRLAIGVNSGCSLDVMRLIFVIGSFARLGRSVCCSILPDRWSWNGVNKWEEKDRG